MRVPFAWLATPAGVPLPRPVGFVWDGGQVVSVHSQPGARVRNIALNPKVTLNFDGDGRGGDIVVLSGTAQVSAATVVLHGSNALAPKMTRAKGTGRSRGPAKGWQS
jgi:PPOX class probable F420-dependent enzyme